ncbi:MAG: DNA-3-methyladenine glycosylase I [Chloroflexi bacterium]|nr:DNA-3-methyladenine glycosylase I [Chloroflexota bacterium]
MSVEDGKSRCEWGRGELMMAYHDQEWGVPLHDDQALFEFLVLEGAQAGLSWQTILNKRQGYRAAFDGFDIEAVARYGPDKVDELLANPGIVRNRAKVHAAIGNAKAVLEVQREFGSFDAYLWGFVDGKPIGNSLRALADVPATTEVSERMSKDLKKRGFKFVGSTICYAHMQATGMVNDHVVSCFRHLQVSELGRKSK